VCALNSRPTEANILQVKIEDWNGQTDVRGWVRFDPRPAFLLGSQRPNMIALEESDSMEDLVIDRAIYVSAKNRKE